MSNSTSDTPKQGTSETPPRPSALETIATVVSGLMVLATIVFLIYESTQAVKPPEFRLHVQKSWKAGEFYHLPVRVSNRGHQAAQAVMLVVKLEEGPPGSEQLESEAQLEWLPGRSSRDVVCVFRNNPGDYAKITPEVKSYEAP